MRGCCINSLYILQEEYAKVAIIKLNMQVSKHSPPTQLHNSPVQMESWLYICTSITLMHQPVEQCCKNGSGAIGWSSPHVKIMMRRTITQLAIKSICTQPTTYVYYEFNGKWGCASAKRYLVYIMKNLPGRNSKLCVQLTKHA